MKFRLLSAVLLTAIMFSCSSDDDNAPAPGADQNYMPLAQGNNWVYDVEGAEYSERDSLYVANDTTISGNTYHKMKTL
ncbi:MAG TPA: hypothetical protein VFQ50_09475, partial [Flavobacterium sp.]|nr:hypothetical protein [Flavobacterium sp.]